MNWMTESIHYESVLSTITLIITLTGLNFLNDRIGKPTVKLALSNICICSSLEPTKKALALDIVNHSIMKVFIGSIQLECYLAGEKWLANMLVDGGSGQVFFRQTLEPGEKFRFTMTLSQFQLSQPDYSHRNVGRIIVTTETGHKFYIGKKEVKRLFEQLELSLLDSDSTHAAG
ncbi:hypothetical protein AB4116_16270 [Vibrio splendidus]